MYVCPAGAELNYNTTDRNGYRHYRSDKAVCAGCPEREKCTKSRQMQNHHAACVEEVKEKANALRLTKWGSPEKGDGGAQLRGCETASWSPVCTVPWSAESPDAVLALFYWLLRVVKGQPGYILG